MEVIVWAVAVIIIAFGVPMAIHIWINLLEELDNYKRRKTYWTKQ
jgi:hypothetical protein